MNTNPFKEYIKQSEPNKRDKGYAWHTAIRANYNDLKNGVHETTEYLELFLRS